MNARGFFLSVKMGSDLLLIAAGEKVWEAVYRSLDEDLHKLVVDVGNVDYFPLMSLLNNFTYFG